MAHNEEENQIIEINSEVKGMVEFAGKDAKTSINMLLCLKIEKKWAY